MQYYLHANAYLIDPAVMALDAAAGDRISIGSLLAGWVIYDVLCRLLGEHTPLLALAVSR